MNRETIEKAAYNYTLNDKKCVKDFYELNAKEEIARTAFIAGAEWRINSVWHDIDKEKPMPGKHVVNEHWFDFVAEDWKDLDRIMKKWPFKRWAYVDDLMPDGKEDK